MKSATTILLALALHAAPIAAPMVTPVAAQEAADTLELDGVRLALVGGATAGAFVYGHVLQSEIWWKGERSTFHVEWSRDWRYALGADKLGHVFFPYAMTHTYGHLFGWSGIDSTTAIWTAASLALGYQTYIEIRDGFSADWGFSWGDFAANTIGAALPVVQHYVPSLRTVEYKISFWPSEKFRAGSHKAIIDDYESTHHWLAFHVDDLLPATLSAHYPDWLDLALGHGVRGLDDHGGGEHELYLALDWNLDGIALEGWAWDLLRHLARHYHLPAPALRIYPDVAIGVRL